MNGLLADELGQLHVLCFLGDEHAHLQDREVADGWFSRVTEAPYGEVRLSADGEALVSVRWEAGPDVTSATCEVVRATWGEVEVTVLDEHDTPAPGAVIAGCGATGETDAHGVATLQVVADAGSCTLHASDGADRDALHSLAPVAEHEQRAVTLRLRDPRRPP
ncbi:MAG: hypothetical protein KC656_19300, partial [Myxococcales bacterium]|nr:hypothetical protein [Myxococcales bacterium]